MRVDTPSWFRSLTLKLKEANIKIIGLKIPTDGRQTVGYL